MGIENTHPLDCPACRQKVMVEVPRVGTVEWICPYCGTLVKGTSEVRKNGKKDAA